MDVARVLWDVGPAGVRDVHAKLNEEREINFATVQTYLRRLECKGYATSSRQGRARIYTAKAKPRTVIRDTVAELVDRLFGGDSMPLVRHLIEDGKMDQTERDELRSLLDQLNEASLDQKNVGNREQ